MIIINQEGMFMIHKKLASSTLLGLILLLFGSCDIKADILFGNKNSGINVNNGSMMVVKTAKPMVIDRGGIGNQGFGKITGQPIQFNRGAYTFFNSVSDIQGALDPNINSIQLGADADNDGGTMIANPGGLSGAHIDNFPGSNILRGQPLFFGPNDLTLQGPSTTLAIAVQNTVNTNITLNGGVLFLQDDLRLGDDAVILDSGRVVFNNRRLSLGGKQSTWSGRILWDSSLDLELNSAINLDGEWLFLGAEGQINGNGNVIDIANGGSIVVLENSNLRLAAVHIKGLGLNGSIKLSPNSTLILTDVVIEMGSNYDFNAGTVIVEGNSTVITKEFILSFVDGPNGSKGKLIVDRVALTYDTLATIDDFNVRPTLILDPNREHVEIIGTGEIRSYQQNSATFVNYRQVGMLPKYTIVAPYRPFYVFPEVNGTEQNFNVILDGNTNFIGFTRTDEKIFHITENVKVTTQNVTLRDLSTKHLGFAPGSSITFGNATNISLARNEVLNYPWVMEGNVNLYGGGKILEFGPNGYIELRGKNSTLLLDGLVLKGLSEDNIRCTRDTSKIILRNTKWIQDGDFTYRRGALQILDDVSMVGQLAATDDNLPDFSFKYMSRQPFTILKNSTLSLTRNMNFVYAPINAAQDLFRFEDASAALVMDQATLSAPSAPNGVVLSTGQLIIRDRNIFVGNVVLNSSLIIDIASGATLEQQF